MNETEILTRRFERERKARVAAESILEQKSREVYQANQELIRVANNLREQMTKNQAILECAAEGIVTINLDCQIQTLNPAAVKIFGLSPEQSLCCDFASFLPEFSPEKCQQVAQQQRFGPEEMIGVRADGKEFVVELTMSLVTGTSEDLLIAIIRDRTKRKQLEAQLALAQKMESVGQLAAGIAHEINTPIQFVGDNVRFLSDAFTDIESLLDLYGQLSDSCQAASPGELVLEKIRQQRQHADLEFIREEIPQAIEQSRLGIDRVATIVKAMKEFSHPGITESTGVDVNQALESTITVSRNEWKYFAEVETQLEDGLPSILGYPGDLNQAFLNIIVNAAHAIEKRGNLKQALGTITVATTRVDDHVVVRISDTGCGIPDDQLSKIFDPFFTTKQVGKGTGQGLAVVHQVVVEKHLGRVEVESQVDVGTTFVISLPIDPERKVEDGKTL